MLDVATGWFQARKAFKKWRLLAATRKAVGTWKKQLKGARHKSKSKLAKSEPYRGLGPLTRVAPKVRLLPSRPFLCNGAKIDFAVRRSGTAMPGTCIGGDTSFTKSRKLPRHLSCVLLLAAVSKAVNGDKAAPVAVYCYAGTLAGTPSYYARTTRAPRLGLGL